MGGVNNGDAVNASITNSAFLEKTADDTTTGAISLAKVDPSVSGPSVSNIQKVFNSLSSLLGFATNLAYNALPSWATTNRGTSSDTVFARVEAIDAAFNGSTGHAHSGSSGDGAPIAAANIGAVPLKGYAVQGTDLTSVNGTSTDLSGLLSGQPVSSGSTVTGIVVTAPYNKIIIRNSGNDQEYVDATGNTVYGRLTNSGGSGGTWTLSYYSEISGTETAYSFSGPNNVRWYYQQLYNPLSSSAPVYAATFFVPSENATADVVDATATQRGVVNTGAQTLAGRKQFNSEMSLNQISTPSTPASGLTLIYTKSDGNLYRMTSSSGEVLVGSSGGGGGSLAWIEDTDSPDTFVEFNNRAYGFGSGLTQYLYALIKVPNSYVSGNQIRLRTDVYTPDTSGTVLIQSIATLIRAGTDAMSTTTNQRTSTNSAITAPGTANVSTNIALDLTDSTGKINGVSVSAGDYIKVQLTRGSDSATSEARVPVYGSEVTTS